jgi:hypothetical protein
MQAADSNGTYVATRMCAAATIVRSSHSSAQVYCAVAPVGGSQGQWVAAQYTLSKEYSQASAPHRSAALVQSLRSTSEYCSEYC